MRDELFFYTGQNPHYLAKFLGMPDNEIELEQMDNGLFLFFYEDIEITPFSIILYVYEDNVFDFFIFEA
jgi:hypothetical protein